MTPATRAPARSPIDALPDVLAWLPRSEMDGLVAQFTSSERGGWPRLDVRRWVCELGRWLPTPHGLRIKGPECTALAAALTDAAKRMAVAERRRLGLDGE